MKTKSIICLVVIIILMIFMMCWLLILNNCVTSDKIDFFGGSVMHRIHKHTLDVISKNKFLNIPKRVIVFDIDDTLLDTNTDSKKEYLEPIPHIVDIFHKAKNLGYITVVITARPPESLDISHKNLAIYNMYPDRIITSQFFGQNQDFKRVLRKNLEFYNPDEIKHLPSDIFFDKPTHISTDNVTIVLTIGDRWTDVLGSKLGIKLPDEYDKRGFYYENNKIIPIN